MHKILALAAALVMTGCASMRRETRHSWKHVERAARTVKKGAVYIGDGFTPRTSYQKQVLAVSAIPGGGWIYECNVSPGPCDHDVSPGVGYFLATAALAFVAVNQHQTGTLAAAASGLFVIRFADVFGAMRAAKRAERR